MDVRKNNYLNVMKIFEAVDADRSSCPVKGKKREYSLAR
jgi:hypothetical protein